MIIVENVKDMKGNNEKIFKISLFFLGFVVILSCGINSTFAANSSSIYVSPQGNDTWDGQSIAYNGTSGPKQTITNAIGTVANNGTIYLASGTYNESDITITTNMTIIGENEQNTIIDAQGQGNIFVITPGEGISLTLVNLTLENGDSTNGGAIFNNGGILNITNVTFNNNTATGGAGGAIWNFGTLIETNDTFNYNAALYNDSDSYQDSDSALGGAIFNDYGILNLTSSTFNNNNASDGGAIWNFGTLTQNYNIFNNNNALNGYGGAIYNNNTAFIIDDIFNNNAGISGGAIFNKDSVTDTNDTFNNNNALNGDGGAIYNGYTGSDTNDTFSNNTAAEGGAIDNEYILTETNDIFNNNSAVWEGGAIDNEWILTGNNNTFNNNRATNINGNGGGAICNHSTLTETNGTFINNTAINDGGAIYNYYGTLIETNGTFINNTAINDGGAIFNEGGIVTVHFCQIVGNTAAFGTQIYNNAGEDNAGTVNATDNWWGSNIHPTTITNLIIVNNGSVNTTTWIILSVNATPGNINNGGSSTITADLTHDSNNDYTSGQGTIPDGILIQFYDTLGNVIGTGTTYNGKASINYNPNIYSGIITVNVTADNANMSTNITVTNRIIYVSTTGNDTTGDGSQNNPYRTISQAILMVSPNGTINIANGQYTGTSNTKITMNKNMTIQGQSETGTIINGTGTNWIFNIQTGTNVVINNLTLTNAINTNYGGAIYNDGGLTIENSTFTGNSAPHGLGGAIYNYDGALTVDNSTFTNNNASEGAGGAIYNFDGALTVDNNTFTGNAANVGYGGAIYNDIGSTLTGTNDIFTNNTATYGGGAICNDGGLTVDNSTFTGNSAPYGNGGAINNEGGGILTETNDTFNNNTATYGGAIYNDGALTVDNSTFTGNSALDDGTILIIASGGAIYNDIGSTLTEANDTFTNNIANLGGAIFDEGILTLDNSTFTGNSAVDGGAIFNWGTLTVDNSTFIGNTANVGGAIYTEGRSTLTETNDTFNNNNATYGGGAIFNGGNGALTVDNSTFTGNSAPDGSGGAIYDSADTASVHFNRIIGNTAQDGGAIFNDGGTIDAEYNWWGSNINPEIIPNLIVNYKGSMNINTWIVLTITANPTTVDYDGVSTVTADLLYDSGILNDPTNPSLYYHDPSNGHVPDGITVDFLGDALGNVNPLVSTFINGSTNTTFTGLQPGVSEISTTVDDQTVTTNININTIPTAITVTSVSGYNGDNVDLIATLTDTHGNVPVQDANVQFSVNGTIIGSANTNTQGIATLPYTITQTSGNYTIFADYLGNNTYCASNSTNNLTVTSTPTVITVTSVSGYNGDNVDLIATLTDTHGNVPVQDANVQFSVNGTIIGSANTNTQGIATLPYTITQTSGNYTIFADYLGNNTYTVCNNTNNLTVASTPTVITVTSVSGYNGDNVDLTATLTDTHGNVPVQDANVQFSVNGTIIGSANTNTQGIATLPYTITQTSGNYTIFADYLGNNTYTVCNNSSKLNVLKTILPSVIGTNPANHSVNVGVSKVIKITFNEPIKAGNMWIELKNSKGTTKSFKATILGNVLSIKPNSVLADGTKYSLILHSNCITDLKGNKFVGSYQTQFTTAKTVPQVISTIPGNHKTGFSRTETITIKFNENIKKGINWSKIVMKNLTQGKRVSITEQIKDNTLYIKMVFLRYAHNWYQITIPAAAIKDVAGNNLQAKYTFKFETKP